MDSKKWKMICKLARETPKAILQKCCKDLDGHTIFHTRKFLDAGLDQRIVDAVTTTHKSDRSDPKRTITNSTGIVDELEGVYGLRFLEFVASALDVKYDAPYHGRGRVARAIQAALHKHWAA